MLKIRPIEFKGNIFTLLVLYIKNYTAEVIKNYILKKIKKYPIFLKNTPIVINISYLPHLINWNNIYNAIISTGLHIVGITKDFHRNFQKDILRSGLPIFSEGKNIFNIMNVLKKKNYSENRYYNQPKIITHPVRSGQKIFVHSKDLIITNNVSAGAELIADGDIHIYGIMRGRVLAGMNGDITRNIFCTKCFAELISIAGEYLLSDQIPIHFLGKGVHIYLKNNILFIYPLL
ncbi:septum site-determining protein MinC [Buchnera aphidicola]|uniref:septum site-determining protein MinC n=1 Tax=Buchnera aphidicola TaxID=9 RepID=UPI0034638A4F